MSTNQGEDSPRRGVWRGSDADSTYRLWLRLLRRCFVALLAIGLLALLLFAITRPFFHSNTHLVVAASDGRKWIWHAWRKWGGAKRALPN